MDQLLIGMTVLSWISLSVALHHYFRYRADKHRLAVHLARWKEKNAVRNAAASGAREVRSKTTLQAVLIAARVVDWQMRLHDLADRLIPLRKGLLFPDSERELQLWIERAGAASRMNVKRFLGMKAMSAGGGLLLALIGYVMGVPFYYLGFVLLPFAGLFGPVLWIRRQAQVRKDQISEDMPDFLDMLSLALQAGAPLDYALRQVPFLFSGPLRDEIVRLNHELDLGVEFLDAWRRMLERSNSPELRKLANSVLQSRRLGVSIASVIRLQADDIRRIRINRAKERAAQSSPKITLVTTLFMAPAVFVFIAGLLVLNIIYNPEGLGVDMLFR